MILKLSAADLRTMTARKRNILIREAHAKVNGSVGAYYAALNGKIRVLEVKHSMKSTVLVRRWSVGKIKETPEVSRWLYYIKVRNDCKKSSRSHLTK